MTDATNIVVYSTDDYGMFKKLLGNRDITKERINNIKESILKSGYRNSPILVNEKMEVIDGQGRLCALKELGIPVLFIVESGLTIKDCINMNIKMKNWTLIDHIKSHADLGNPNYVRIYETLTQYKKLNPNCVFEVILGKGFGSATQSQISDGLVICKEITDDMRKTLDWLTEIVKLTEGKGGNVLKILAKLYNLKLIDRNRMLEQFKKYHSTKPVNAKNADSILAELNELYNFNRKSISYFTDAYKEKTKCFSKGKKEETK